MPAVASPAEAFCPVPPEQGSPAATGEDLRDHSVGFQRPDGVRILRALGICILLVAPQSTNLESYNEEENRERG